MDLSFGWRVRGRLFYLFKYRRSVIKTTHDNVAVTREWGKHITCPSSFFLSMFKMRHLYLHQDLLYLSINGYIPYLPWVSPFTIWSSTASVLCLVPSLVVCIYWVMCQSTTYSISAESVVRDLSQLISVFGIPKVIQSDQVSNFASRLFAQVLQQLHIKHNKSSAYHPQSRGALERFHQHLKSLN